MDFIISACLYDGLVLVCLYCMGPFIAKWLARSVLYVRSFNANITAQHFILKTFFHSFFRLCFLFPSHFCCLKNYMHDLLVTTSFCRAVKIYKEVGYMHTINLEIDTHRRSRVCTAIVLLFFFYRENSTFVKSNSAIHTRIWYGMHYARIPHVSLKCFICRCTIIVTINLVVFKIYSLSFHSLHRQYNCNSEAWKEQIHPSGYDTCA